MCVPKPGTQTLFMLSCPGGRCANWQLTQCVNVKSGAQASEECTRMHRLIPFFQVLFFVLRPDFFFFLVSLCCCFCFLSMNFSSLVFFNLKLNVSASKEAK